jgi:predicted permease
MITDLLHRLRSLFRREQVEREMDEELRFHYDAHIERGIRSGLTPGEARRQARLAVGSSDSVKEEYRDARGVSALESVAADVRYAARGLAKSPGFACVVVCSLAIGIGANTAIFSLMDALLWRALPIQDPAGLHLVGTRYEEGTVYGYPYKQYRLIADHSPWFSGVAAYGSARVNVSIDGGTEPTADAQMVTGGYFQLLGVRAALGRTIGGEDDRVPNGHPVVMISHAYWQRRFAGDRGVVGKTVHLCGTPFTIVGVTPREFFGVEVGRAPDFFAPVMMQPALMPALENLLANPIITRNWLRPVGRLNPGMTVARAESQLDALIKANQVQGARIPPANTWKLVLTPAANGISDLRRQFSQPLAVLMAMVVALLALACANAANMLLARAASRAPEFAMRRALGAGRERLMQQVLVESLLLAGGGGLLGLLLAHQATRFLVTFLSTGRSPVVLNVAPDLRVLAFTVAVSLATGLLFGLVPAFRSSRTNPSLDLRGLAGTGGDGRHALRPGKLLVVAQVALSLVLLAAAALFVRSLQKLNAQDSGFPRESVLTMRVEPRGSDQRNVPGAEPRLDRTYRALLESVRAIPGVRAASLAHFTPTSPIGFSSPLQLASGEQLRVSRLMVYPGYFETMGIPLLSGRDFGPRDLDENSPYVAVVNETFARHAFPGANPVGQTFQTSGGRGRATLSCQIIGVVKDSKYTNLRGAPPPVILQPFLQTNTGRGQMTLHVRIAGQAAAVVSRLRQEVQKIDPALPLFEVRSLADEMDAAMVRERVMATLAAFFGAVALALACVGLYGLFSFAVIRRTREIGVRMALGANSGRVVGMVMREVAVLLGAGLAIGTPIAFATGRLASSQIAGLLFGLTPTDPVSLGIATAVLAAVAAFAGFLPAVRAAGVQPAIALRTE